MTIPYDDDSLEASESPHALSDWQRFGIDFGLEEAMAAADAEKRFGPNPTPGQLLAAEMRADCNKLTAEERQELDSRAMGLFYGDYK